MNKPPEISDYRASRREAAGTRFRAWLNLAMGVVYILLGGGVMYLKYFGTIELGSVLAYFLGALFMVYGLFRIWRGSQDLKILREE